MQRLPKGERNKMRRDAITSTNRKPTETSRKELKKKKNGKEIVKKSIDKIIDKMDVKAESTCFVTTKDHKKNFLNNPKIRLVNPGKNELKE